MGVLWLHFIFHLRWSLLLSEKRQRLWYYTMGQLLFSVFINNRYFTVYTLRLVPKEAETFSDSCFEECTEIEYLTFNSNSKVTTFCNSLFIKCTKLTEIQFPSQLTTIGEKCFQKCELLSIITFPPSLMSIGSSAFSDCKNLKVIKFCGSNYITGSNVFPETLTKIYVSPIYNGTTFCSIQVISALRYDCEYRNKRVCTFFCRRYDSLLSYSYAATAIILSSFS